MFNVVIRTAANYIFWGIFLLYLTHSYANSTSLVQFYNVWWLTKVKTSHLFVMRNFDRSVLRCFFLFFLNKSETRHAKRRRYSLCPNPPILRIKCFIIKWGICFPYQTIQKEFEVETICNLNSILFSKACA